MPNFNPEITLTPEEIAVFQERGYLSLPAITTSSEVASLRQTMERLFTEKAGRAEGAHFDALTHDEEESGSMAVSLPTIISPVNFAPELRHTHFRAHALSIARQLLGPQATPAFENAILKPAFHGGATPWHQDEATRVDDGFEYQQLSIWMPLQDATVENGCMSYIPGSHRSGVLPHGSPNRDTRVHALECTGGFDPSHAVPCPLPAGGAAIHQGRTLHYAGPNRTENPRFAYILAFENPPKPLAEKRNFYWNREKQTASLQRKRQWRKQGGILVEVVRRVRYGALSPKRILFEVRRAGRAILSRS